MLSWREITETIGMDVRECTKKWENYRDKNVYPPLKNLTTTKSRDPGGKEVPAFYLFRLAGTACTLPGHITWLLTHNEPHTRITVSNSFGPSRTLYYRF